MYLISTFIHSTYLELAINDLENKGITRDKILAVPINKRIEEKKLMDTINQADGISLFDGAAAMGTAFMVLGTIYGFILKWGPIIWAIIGLFVGAGLGLLLDLLISKRRGRKMKAGDNAPEVVLMINCDNSQADMVETVLYNHLALGVGRLDRY